MASLEPEKFGGKKRSPVGPAQRLNPPDAANVEPHDQLAKAALLTETIRYLESYSLKSLPSATKDLLSTYGLLDRGIIFQHLNTQTLIDFSQLFSTLPIGAQELACRSLVIAVDRFGRRTSGTMTAHLKQVALWLSEHGGDVAASYRKLVLALIEDENLDLGIFKSESLREDLWSRFDRLRLDQKLRLYLPTPASSEQEILSLYLGREGQPNDLPFLNSEQFRVSRDEVRHNARSIAIRSWRHALNFQRLSGECRRAAPGVDAVLATFGRDNFEEVSLIHSSSTERTPGRGYFISGPRLENLFHDWPGSVDVYRKSYSAYGRALSEFSDVSFCFLRNAIIAHHPSQEYQLPVGDLNAGLREPYALYIENDHFSGGYDLAALVPWRILREKIAPCLKHPEGLAPTRDVSQPGFNLVSLSKEGDRQGTPVVMLANISTIFGGSVAGYPKGSLPFFSWERGTEQVDPWNFDILGRLHYLWYLKVKTGQDSFIEATSPLAEKLLTKKRIDLLAPLGEGCHQVANAAKGLFDLLNLFYARYDAWKCGLTPTDMGGRAMLQAIETWHTSLRERNAPESQYPVLCVAHRYDWNQRPAPLLDTFTMRPYGAASMGTSPSFSLGEWWNQSVIPLVSTRARDGSLGESEKTLLLLAREYVL